MRIIKLFHSEKLRRGVQPQLLSSWKLYKHQISFISLLEHSYRQTREPWRDEGDHLQKAWGCHFLRYRQVFTLRCKSDHKQCKSGTRPFESTRSAGVILIQLRSRWKTACESLLVYAQLPHQVAQKEINCNEDSVNTFSRFSKFFFSQKLRRLLMIFRS